MITIRTLFAQINIDQNKEYIIYDVNYPADRFGRPLPEDSEDVKSGNCYDYGNIIIETERKRYTLPTVYSSYEWVADLINYINSHRDKEHIFVDMFELWKLPDGTYREFDCGRIRVETI